MENTLLLIDTFYFLHRSFHAFPLDMATSDGEPTNITYGFTSSLLDMLLEFSPTHIACSWESEEQPSFRKELYGQYQAHREPGTPEEEEIFGIQLPRVMEIMSAFNIPRFMENGFEGDDLLGTVATKASRQSSVIIATSDQDLLQLVNEKISVYRPSRPPFTKKMMFTPDVVRETYGFSPPQMIDYKALRGDPSDNIPGVKGVGEKTAKDLLEKYHTLEGIYEHLDTITPAGVHDKLLRDRDAAFLSKQLATIITDIPISFDLHACLMHDFDIEKVRELCIELEFKSLIRKIDKLEKIQTMRSEETNKKKNKTQYSLL